MQGGGEVKGSPCEPFTLCARCARAERTRGVPRYFAVFGATSGSREVPGCVYLPNRLGHLQTYSTKLDRPGQYAGWLGRGYDPLATAIRIGNPVSYDRAVRTLQRFDGVVGQATEDELADAAARADLTGMFNDPHTGVALAVLETVRRNGELDAWRRDRRLPELKLPEPVRKAA